MPNIYYTDLPNIMHEMIDDEVVVVNLDNGTYYSFDGVGGQVWSLIGGEGRSLASLTTKAASLYAGESEQIAAAVGRFIGQLTDEGLLRIEAGEDKADDAKMDAGAPPSAPFVEPSLQKYTDMEALLLADPIHEVDDAGWPHLK